MSINIYQTQFGLFSVIADGTALSNLRSLPEGKIFDDNGTITALGTSLIMAVPLSATFNTIMVNDLNFDPRPYNHIASIAPNTVIKQLSGVTENDQVVNYTLKDTKKAYVWYRYYMTPQDLRAGSGFDYNSDYYTVSNNDCPYGVFKTSGVGGSKANRLHLTILVSNDDMTDFDVLDMRFDVTTATMFHNPTNKNTYLSGYFNGVEPIHINSDPYAPGGSSGTGGGTGSFDGTGDDVEIPGLPTLSAVDTGFITLFNPTPDELRNLANYMWGDLFDVSTWKKIFADPMDAILGLSIVPVAVPDGGKAAVKVGNISTDVSMNKAAAQYVSVDCGTLNVEEFWGGYLDYAPFTKAEIYLPYIGIHPLAVDDIMGKSVHVVYHIDILSGSCCAYVKCGGSVLYSFVGQCSCSIPITGNDWTNVINGALSIAASIGTMVATGGASAPTAASTIVSTAVNSMKPNVEKSGSMGGTGGMLGVQTPYIIITRPNQALPEKQNSFTGYPSFITSKLESLSGYTEIEEIHLENIPGTEQEISEIESLLKEGVII